MTKKTFCVGIIIIANLASIIFLRFKIPSLLDQQYEQSQLSLSLYSLGSGNMGKLIHDYARNLQNAMELLQPSKNWSFAYDHNRFFLSARSADYFEKLKRFPQIKTIFLKYPREKLLDILPIHEFYDYSASNCTLVEATRETVNKSVLQDQYSAVCCSLPETLIPVDLVQRIPASLRWGVPPGTPMSPDTLLSYVHLIPNGYVVNDGIVATGNVTLQENGCKMAQMGRAFSASKTKANNYRTVDKVYVIQQFWGQGFFHSSVENIPRLAPLLGFLHKNKDVYVSTKANHQGILTKMLGIENSRIIRGPVQAKIVILPAGVSCGNPSLLHMQLLWQYYHTLLPSKPVHSRDTIVLIRRSTKRFFRYHDAIHQMLLNESSPFNMSVVVFDDRRLPNLNETARMFNEAFIVVAPHGAGESNLIFSQPGTVLIEGLCHPLNFCYRALAQTLGLRYYAHVRKDKSCREYTAEELAVPVRFYLKHKHSLS